MPLRDPLVAPLAAFAGGILVSRLAGFAPAEALAAFLALATLAVLARWKTPGRVARAAALTATGFAGILADAAHRPAPAPVVDFEPREILVLAGCVVEPPVWSPDRTQFVVELERGARVRVTLYPRQGERPPELDYGERVELEARLRRPRNFGNPGSFDYAGYLARRDIYWTASSSGPVTRLGADCGGLFHSALYRLRRAALDRLDRLYAGDPYALAMARAVLVGDASRLEKVWTEHYRRTGTYHALVISGLQLTTLAACLLFLLRLCSAGAGVSLGVTAAVSWIYALLAGADPPVVRAAGGLTLYLVGRWWFRKPRVLNLLAAVGFVFLLVEPQQLFDASFQLSFLAVAAIGAIVIPILEATTTPYSRAAAAMTNPDRDHLLEPAAAQWVVELRLLAETLELAARVPHQLALRAFSWIARLGFFFVDLLVVSAVVQLAMTLPMAIYFHRVSFSGLSANLLIVPLMNLVVPLGFAAVLTGWLPPAALAGHLLAASRAVAEWHARREPDWRIPDPPAWLVAAFLASLVLAAASISAGRRRRLAAAAAFAAALAALVSHPFAARLHPGRLEVTAIDVGQGDSLLVVSPEGRLMLLDCGGLPSHGRASNSSFDIGEDVVSTYLWSRSIRRLDVIAITHAHEDHIGGLPALLANFRPGEIWYGALPEATLEQVRAAAASRGIAVRARGAGELIRWGGALVEVLSPPQGHRASSRSINNDSLVLRVSYGSRSAVLTGDIERGVEERLAREGLLSRSDILKVAHHGSKTSTHAAFLEAAQPAFAVISAGDANQFGHPNAEVLARLAESGVRYWRTDRSGQVMFLSDGHRIGVETPLWPAPSRAELGRLPPF